MTDEPKASAGRERAGAETPVEESRFEEPATLEPNGPAAGSEEDTLTDERGNEGDACSDPAREPSRAEVAVMEESGGSMSRNAVHLRDEDPSYLTGSPDTLHDHVELFAEQACGEMRNVLARSWEKLDRRRRTAQEALDELRRFKEDNGLERQARLSSRRDARVALGAIAGVATAVTAALFAGPTGSLFADLPEAVLMTLLNVTAVGLLGRLMVGLTVHRRLGKRIAGWICSLVVLTPLLLSVNLFTAHYRDALYEDFPGLIRSDDRFVSLEEAAANPDDVLFHPCQKNQDRSSLANDPDYEALCLATRDLFDLHSYKSYLLFVVGLMTAGLAAWIWAFRLADPYLGFGRREREWQSLDRKLQNAKTEAMDAIASLHAEAVQYVADHHRAMLITAAGAGSAAAMAKINACRVEAEGGIAQATRLR